MILRRFPPSTALLLGFACAGMISFGQATTSGGLSDAVSSSTPPSCTASLGSPGDGVCDDDLNTEQCGYDGGDCCPCTCQDGPVYYCGTLGYSCTDPDASCVDDDDGDTSSGLLDDSIWPGVMDHSTSSGLFHDDDDGTTFDCITAFVSDNDCDLSNNHEGCGYDGGDCCSCTCTDAPGDYYQCGSSGYACVDPDASCVNDDDEQTFTSSDWMLSDDSSLPSEATTDDDSLFSDVSPTADDSSPSFEESLDADDDEATEDRSSDDPPDSGDGQQSPASAAPSLVISSTTIISVLVAVFVAMQSAGAL